MAAVNGLFLFIYLFIYLIYLYLYLQDWYIYLQNLQQLHNLQLLKSITLPTKLFNN